MRRLMCGLAVLACALVMSGCKSAEQRAKEEAANKADLQAMEGRWTVASQVGDPDAAGEDDGKPKAFEVKIENGILRKMSNGETFERQKMTINALANPKTVDLVAVKEDGSPEQRKYRVWEKGRKGKPGKWVERTGQYKVVGIYKIDGDNLQLATSYDEKDRPTELSQGPGRQLLKLKKIGGGEKKDGEKKDDKKPEKKDDKKPEKKDDKKPEKKDAGTDE